VAYAEATADRIIEAVVPEYGNRSVRELIVGSHRVVCWTSRDQVVVVALAHGSRDLVARLGSAPWHVR
jgi:plasmid stabilization system protein ParE